MMSSANLELLKSVSRSFYLSIRFLPAAMREPVALGYLLARLTDTIADAEGIEDEQRLEALASVQEVIRGACERVGLEVKEIASEVEHLGEKRLLGKVDELTRWYQSMDEANRTHLEEVMTTIIHGQEWDIVSFRGGQVAACESREDLLRYTYWVAGCVGEFWTKVGFTNLGERFARPEDASAMLVEGKQLGQGLQMINLLRDLHEDLPRGRCYLPADELKAEGWNGEGVPARAVLEPVIERWLCQCEDFLGNAESYTRRVRSYRAAFCTRLPMELAKKTAAVLRMSGTERVLAEKVKIPRSAVWKSMAGQLFW